MIRNGCIVKANMELMPKPLVPPYSQLLLEDAVEEEEEEYEYLANTLLTLACMNTCLADT
jgi:hypothetical protein